MPHIDLCLLLGDQDQLLDFPSAGQSSAFPALPAGTAHNREIQQSACFHFTFWLPILMNKVSTIPRNGGSPTVLPQKTGPDLHMNDNVPEK